MTGFSVLNKQENAQLVVARHAARLFLEQGFAATAGSDIARASGLSERTIWRYFRTKESCVAPLLAVSWRQFATELHQWPLALPLEAHLTECFALERQSPEFMEDGLLIARLIAALPDQPELRPVWLLSYNEGEDELMAIIAERIGRSPRDFDIRLCAAAVMAAIRIVDETICLAAIRHGQVVTGDQAAAQMARAMRAAATLPFCDPVAPRIFGGKP